MPAVRTRDAHPRPSLAIDTAAASSSSAPEPPSVAIIAPTPRQFAFPPAVQSAGPARPGVSPFSSPCASPFELERRTPLTPCATPPLVRTYTPSSELSSPTSSLCSPGRVTPPPSASAAAAAWRRRQSAPSLSGASTSAASAAGEPDRRPRKGDEDYIKRPENAFILFRRKCVEDRLQAQHESAAAAAAAGAPPAEGKPKKARQADLSKMISQQWKALSADERAYWESQAKERKREHEQMYPHYVYRPQRVKKADKAKAAAAKAKGKAPAAADAHAERAALTDQDSISFALPIPAAPMSRHGRSLSAPSPPVSYQMVQLPAVLVPSCPSSPGPAGAPLPRRSPRPSDDGMLAFPPADFPPPFGHPDAFPQVFDVHDPSGHPGLSQLVMSMGPIGLTLVSPTDSLPSPFTPGANPDEPLGCTPDGVPVPDFGFDLPMPELVLQPWCYEGVSLWPGVDAAAPMQSVDFELGAIPPIALELPKYDADADGLARARAEMAAMSAQPAPGSSASDCGPQTHGGPWLDARSEAGDPFAGLAFDDMMISDHHRYW